MPTDSEPIKIPPVRDFKEMMEILATLWRRRERGLSGIFDAFLRSPVHPSIPWSPLAPPQAGKPQGERIMKTVGVRYSVHGEVSNHEHSGASGLFTSSSCPEERKLDKATGPKSETNIVELFADGACSGNPGPGGYGVILRYRDQSTELSGFAPHTTNNRMELTGVIEGLRRLKRPCRVRVITDSTYLVKGMTEWITGWVRKKWMNSQKKPVLNRDLWEELLELAKPHKIEWVWTAGHSGHKENERCDELARRAMRTRRSTKDDHE